MRVLFISVRADRSGGPTHLYSLMKGLSTKNVECFVASPAGYYQPFYRGLCSESVIIPERSFSLYSIYKLMVLVKKNNIDIIHSHGRGAGFYSKMLKFVLKVKVVHSFHGIHFGVGVVGKIKFFTEKIFKTLSDLNICVSKGELERAHLYKLSSGKEVVIYNGVDVDSIRSTSVARSRETICENYGLDPAKDYIGCLTRNDFAKGVDLLVDKFCHKDKLIDCELVIAMGEKGEFEFSKKLENIHFLGEQDGAYDMLILCRAFVSHSRSEGLPLVCLEALAAGVPLLLSDISGHREIVNADSGYLFANQIEFNKGLKSIMTNELKPIIDEKFTDRVMIDKTYSVYKSILN